METRQYKLLKTADSQILDCLECQLHVNGRAKPWWTEKSKYLLIGEAPGANEVLKTEPFVGTSGKNLWGIAGEYGLSKEDFLVINTCNCRPVIKTPTGVKNGKPTPEEMEKCRPWINVYWQILKPTKIILLGAYAMKSILGIDDGIMHRNGSLTEVEIFGILTKVVVSVHPAMCVYRGEDGKNMLRTSFKVFSEA